MIRKTDTTDAAALRHIVFRDLLAFLPPASYDQAGQLIANLRLARSVNGATAEISLIFRRFIDLRCTPDIAETAYKGFSVPELEIYFGRKYGDRLAAVAGFYQDTAGAWRLNMPERCVMFGYRDHAGTFAGVLCQPIDRADSYFLLSSARFDGPKAERLTAGDRDFFNQFDRPAAAAVVNQFLKRAA